MPQMIRNGGEVVVTGIVTLQTVESIHTQLLALEDRSVVTIDCSAATEVDVSLVQLILAARTTAQQTGRAVVLAQPADGALLETLERGGFLSASPDEPVDLRRFWLEAGS